MKIESDKVEVSQSSEKLFNYLTNFNNFQSLMPPQVTNWQSTENDCSFTISGMASVGMKIVDKTPHTLVRISSNGKVPFNFTLDIKLDDKGAEGSIGQLIFESDINPMMKMMVEKPLTNFFNALAHKMKDIK